MALEKAKVVVTGAAGFIGSHLAESLIREGYHVIGIDSFTNYYPRTTKELNLKSLLASPDFDFIEGDLLEIDLAALLRGARYVFHEAAQAGVRGSWGDSFEIYMRNNIFATQKLLESVKDLRSLSCLIFASSSSIYGDAEKFPTSEKALPKPVSPYGVTKLACEHLCRVYQKSFGVPITILRYFTVYGPRQRPDMAFYRFIKAMTQKRQFTVYGNGEQTRNFTYISDIVEANILAMKNSPSGEIFNIGGGTQISVNKVIRLLEGILGYKASIQYSDWQKGDAYHTGADVSYAKHKLGYVPKINIKEGLQKQVEWQVSRIEEKQMKESKSIRRRAVAKPKY